MKKINTLFIFIMVFATIGLFAAPVTVNTFDSQGNPIPAKFKVFKGPNYVGEYDAGTSVDLTVGHEYKIFAHYIGTSTERITFTVDPAGNTFNFYTTKISFHFTGGYHNYRASGGWKKFNLPSMELFPKDFYGNVMKFQFGYGPWNDNSSTTFEVDYAGETSIEKTVICFKLKYADGSGAPNGVGQMYHSGWKTAPGVTDSKGWLNYMIDGIVTGNRKFRMNYPTSPSVSPTSNEVYFNLSSSTKVMFELSRVTARLWDGTENLPEANGGDLGILHVYNSGWKEIGQTDDGTLEFDIFAKNRKYRMKDVNYSKYEKYYNVPVGYYNMDFPIVRQCVQAKDQTGALVVDTDFKAWIYYSGWKYLGKDSDDGLDGIIMKGVLKGNWKYKMELGPSKYEKYWNSVPAIFPAVRNFIQVHDQTGTPLGIGDPDGKVWVYYSGWKYIGKDSDDGTLDGLISTVLLQGNRKFKMELSYSKFEKYWNYSQANPDVIFPGVRNPVEVRDQFDALMPDTDAPVDNKVYVYYSGWKHLGAFNNGVLNTVLLQGNRKFKAIVNYSKYEKYWHIKQDDGTGNPALATFPVIKDVFYLGNVCKGYAGATAKVYYSGWKTLGTTDADGEIKNMSLLEGNWKFKLSLASGAYREAYKNLNKTDILAGLILFKALQINLNFGGTATYYDRGWKTFSSPMTIFYGDYNVKLNTTYTTTLTIDGCDLDFTLVKFHLDHSAFIGGGASDAYGMIKIGSSWKTSFRTTGSDGDLYAFFPGTLSGNYRLKMKYPTGTPGFDSYSVEKVVNITSSTGNFQLTDAHFRAWDPTAGMVVTSTLGGDPNGKVSVKVGSTYKELGTLGTAGELHIEMFAQTLNFLCSNYNWVQQYKNGHNLSASNIVNFNTRMKAVAAKDGTTGIPNVDIKVKVGSSYKSLGVTDVNGEIGPALLHGTFNFSGYINNTLQYKNGHNLASGQAILTVNLNPVQVVDGSTGVGGVSVYVKEGSTYKLMGTTDATGWITNYPLMRGNI